MCSRLAQPFRRSVWNRADLNTRYRDFYRNTLETIDRGWVRPRYPGYVVDQLRAGAALERCLRETASARATLEAVRMVFRKRTGETGGLS
jgi:multiple sugar transport system substrate-binding protein